MARSWALLLLWPALAAAAPATQPSLRDFEARIPAMRAAIPALARSAEAAAARIVARPESLLNLPYWEQIAFSEEQINRAGGLAHAYPTGAPGRAPSTPNDVVLFTIRSWEKDGKTAAEKLAEYRKEGWQVSLIASKAGTPPGLPVDFLVDNGAPDGSVAQARINLIANVTLGWMWACEYASAMTRQGKAPAVLLSVGVEGGEEWDKPLQTQEGRHKLFDCASPVPAGSLAELYLRRVERLVGDLKSPRIQDQVAAAADVVARRMAGGGTVGLSGVGHVILTEVKDDIRAPFKGFQAVGSASTAFKSMLKPGDLLVWIAYAGMNSKYDDYAKYIAEAKVDLVTSYAPDPVLAANPPPTLAHIDQCWALPDAEVPIPFKPGKMAPVSGVNSALVLRMLDDEVAARLEKVPAASRPSTAPTGR